MLQIADVVDIDDVVEDDKSETAAKKEKKKIFILHFSLELECLCPFLPMQFNFNLGSINSSSFSSFKN